MLFKNAILKESTPKNENLQVDRENEEKGLIDVNFNVQNIIKTITNLKDSNNGLRMQNRELNGIIVELKLIISRIYNKIYYIEG